MEANSIVPDVISKEPEGILKIIYNDGESEVNFGNELTPTQVKDEPTTLEWNVEEDAYYLLCMTDPDAPSRDEPSWREWHHWLVGNIPGTDVSLGETLSAYVGSAPPPGTGLHRYCFLVYQQPDKLQFDEKRLTNQSAENRECFSISKFAEKYQLGDPVAGNFFVAQYDDWCAEVYKRFGVSI
uniref:OV-16 antigen n=2 Tax=Lygus hesperus TaxID=30085 RepID=A0A0A9XHF3_LYGHE